MLIGWKDGLHPRQAGGDYNVRDALREALVNDFQQSGSLLERLQILKFLPKARLRSLSAW